WTDSDVIDFAGLSSCQRTGAVLSGTMAALPTPPLIPPPGVPLNVLPSRQNSQNSFAPVGIAAGAEDVKYQAKYKDLKRKLKEIEADNDRLHYRVLQAKRSIQRMKIERAVLYERLQLVPTSPEPQERHTHSSVHPSPGMQGPQHHAMAPNHMSARDLEEYNRGSHPRSGPVESPRGPGSHPRRGSGGIPGQPQLQFMPQQFAPAPHEPHRNHAPPPVAHSSPALHAHERTRSPSRGRGHSLSSQQQVYHPSPYGDPPPLHSPPLSDRGRSRHEMHEPVHRHQNSLPPLSPPAGRIHPHQRMGPGTYINREEPMPERDWDRERRDAPMDARSPNSANRSRAEYPDTHQNRRREEAGYFGDRPAYSRSDSPGSRSGSGSGAAEGVPSRPDSRTQFYPEAERGPASGAPRTSFRLRPVGGEEVDFGAGNTPPPAVDSRKRSRNEMDVDSEEPSVGYPETRSSKRFHQT
ncbi:unnamed protein product, partial [Mycena citricolor]